jgi:hypothetical protein
VNLDGAGTVTHLAPEMFKAGTIITKAVDAYAFGILLWEVYTGQRAFAGRWPDEIRIERQTVCNSVPGIRHPTSPREAERPGFVGLPAQGAAPAPLRSLAGPQPCSSAARPPVACQGANSTLICALGTAPRLDPPPQA